ncbi:MAG: glycoside hydrolase family 2 [Flammeovirgaceae bacterium]|nr:glycoside hydrolase family 2 [Flammeovirgaceae bacterium]HCX24131.1 glycoside hydrolase family 2 [Cytophagales bacterium]
MKNRAKHIALIAMVVVLAACQPIDKSRKVIDFTDDWQFTLSKTEPYENTQWRTLDLPHDWSIEGEFSPDHPATVGGGALPGGIGWYQKSFQKPADFSKVFIQFDGVYQNSTVWVNGDSVGNRPNGYISFEYDLTPFLKEGDNQVLVKVANDPQPNSRWYSGSGIYRDVRLVYTNNVFIPNYGIYVNPTIEGANGLISTETKLTNSSNGAQKVVLKQEIVSPTGQVEVTTEKELTIMPNSTEELKGELAVLNPELWKIESPNQYTLKSSVLINNEIIDVTTTKFGFRTFRFDVTDGFFLNGESVKIKGVCLHHDLGALGAAFNKRAAQRQIEIMQGMGVNAIRTSHNPPAPQFLDLCDEMGILVMDEMFDMWAKSKTEFDYSQYWDDWHEQDLKDFILRDRNHPSIIAWSVGNEIIEQYNHEDSIGGVIAAELAEIVRELDSTRPITTANNDISPDNPLIKYGGLDLVGYNYHHENFLDVPKDHPGKPFIATETNSSLATRGHYDMPSDSLRAWPIAWDKLFTEGNPDNTVSAYDHVRAPWGSTQEDTWRIVKNNDFISGIFIWTGFDYLGEPTPYVWPSRSSYFGIVDLAGFPKDTYYMYQSEWTEDTVLHVFPHWNLPAGEEGKTIDVWAYYNHADEVELFLNGESKGVKQKGADDFHVMWRLEFVPGTVEVISRKDGQEVSKKTLKTAGDPAELQLEADRSSIAADGDDLSYITVNVLDADGNIVPYATNLVSFEVTGPGQIVGVDNGDPTSHLSLKGDQMKAMAGKCLVIVQSTDAAGAIQLTAKAEGLPDASIVINSK